MNDRLQIRPNAFSADLGHYTDSWAEDILWTIGVEEVLEDKDTEFQRLRVIRTKTLGNVLVLDGAIQVSEADEAGYHELLVHPGLCRIGARSETLRTLIIGGGDGGAARQILAHPGIESVELVELDPAVPEAARAYFPGLWSSPQGSPLDEDPRFSLHIADGAAFVHERASRLAGENGGHGLPARPGSYDLIVVDSTDPVGPGEALFSPGFYADCHACLRPGGAVAVQAGSWFFLPKALRLAHQGLQASFQSAFAYQCWSAIYPGGLWNLVLATDGPDPRLPDPERVATLGPCAYYDAAIHRAAFALPPAARQVLAGSN